MDKTFIKDRFQAFFNSSTMSFTAYDVFESLESEGSDITETDVEEVAFTFCETKGWSYIRLWAAGILREHHWQKIGTVVDQEWHDLASVQVRCRFNEVQIVGKSPGSKGGFKGSLDDFGFLVTFNPQEVEQLKSFLLDLWYCDQCKQWIHQGTVCPNCRK